LTDDPWETHASWWRSTFTGGADPEYELQILPLLAEHLAQYETVLDLGTGEGQLARRLVSSGPPPRLVVGVDPSRAQLSNAIGAGAGPLYVLAAGESLPFRDGAFEAVACCLVIEHATDPDRVLSEAVRVLAPGGRFVLLVNHPSFQGPGSGLVDDQILKETYWRVGPYLKEQVALEDVGEGVRLRFAHRPLGRYVNPLVELGLALTRLEEPSPPEAFLEESIDIELEAAIPRLAMLRFDRVAIDGRSRGAGPPRGAGKVG